MKDITSPEKVEQYMNATALHQIFDPEVLPHCRLFAYEHGEQIVTAGDEVRYLLFLVEGKAKPYGMLANGKVYLFRIEAPLSVYGDIEVLKDRGYTANVEAVGSAICVAVPIHYIRKHCLDSPPFLQYIISTLADRLDKISRGSAENLLLPLKNKLALYLVTACASGDTMTVSSSYLELAEKLGTTYRHLSRVFREMTEEGLIEKKGKVLRILDKERMEILAEEIDR